MQYKELGQTGLKISTLCLGSMTWGTQNTSAEGCAQIDQAMEAGVNILDTAEMYPVTPISKETQGDTERVVGDWVKQSGKRDKLVIATKVSGAGLRHVRGGAPISAQTITEAVEGSLSRMNTDYIDIYQLHWPNRGSYMFRQNWNYDPTGQNRAETLAHIEEVLGCFDGLIKAGKIRHIGLSNESAWGTAQWLRIADEKSLPRVASIQNEYSLLCRMFDTDLAELCHNEDVGLLAFSPLATGLLTGKYQNGATPAGSRKTIQPNLSGRVSDRVFHAVDAYQKIADKHGLNLAQMALAWCQTRPFMGSAIFGATSPEQLSIALGSNEVSLSNEVLEEINLAHKAHPMPY